MSFKTWLHNDYRAMNEEADQGPLDVEAAVDQQATAAEANKQGAAPSKFGEYLVAQDLTEHLAKLGSDVGDAVLNFATKTFVKPEMFDSKDAYDKYINAMNQKIGLDYKKKMIEVLSNAGVFIENTKRSLGKKSST